MGVYIDRGELLELYANTDDLDISNYDVKIAVIRQNILDMPTIDIVRCEECIHFHYDKPYIIQGIPVFGHEVCDFWGDGCKTNPNGFCSYGERRADDNTIKADK